MTNAVSEPLITSAARAIPDALEAAEPMTRAQLAEAATEQPRSLRVTLTEPRTS